jgi:hypothetical protein
MLRSRFETASAYSERPYCKGYTLDKAEVAFGADPNDTVQVVPTYPKRKSIDANKWPDIQAAALKALPGAGGALRMSTLSTLNLALLRASV